MTKPLFSIIIPTLNEEQYLPRLLSDLAAQKEKDFEVIVVDACSKDKTKEKALFYKDILSLQFVESKKLNVSYQRNTGASLAKGRFLLFLDADSRVQRSFTRTMKKHLFRSKKFLFLPILIPEERTSRNVIIFTLINTIIEASHSLRKPLSAGGALFIERTFFKSLSGFDETLFLSEDHNLVKRAYKKKVKPTILKDVKVTFSTRRVKHEGEIMFLYKSLFSLIYFLVNGEVRNKIFSYEMGGQAYQEIVEQMTWGSALQTKRIRYLFKKVSAYLN